MRTIVPSEMSLRPDQNDGGTQSTSKKKLHLAFFGMLFCVAGAAQTYTTIANGSWSSASTWKNGSIPATGAITSGTVINIKHSVTYTGSTINNSGTINISNPGGVAPRLILPSGINFNNKSGGILNINNGELRQYRFAGGGESGTSQTGSFTNNGTISATNSFIEIAQNWSDVSGAISVFNNSSLEFGQGFSIGAGSSDSLLYTSVSVGMQGNGNFTITNGNVYFRVLRVEVASSDGQFALNGGTINGTIDYIALKNHLTNSYSNGQIQASNITTSKITLASYCINNPSHYKPNGNFIGSQTPDCSSNYFPAPLMNGTNSSRLNFSTNPVLISGTDKLVGAEYKYEGAAAGMDALVTVDSIVNGAVINSVDDNTGANGGYIEAFQPIITSGHAVGSSYVVFRFNYKVTGTMTDVKLDTAVITALDIDGGNNLHEFDQISLGTASTASYMALNPLVSLGQILPGTFKGLDLSGIAHPGVDTSSKGNMFTITNTKVSSFTAKLGILTTSAQTTQRLFSLYAKSFNYPNPISLPVKLEEFTAQFNKPNVLLSWKSADETNFNYYELEHSTDGNVFTTTSIIFAAAKNGEGADYSYVDKSVAKRGGLIYYRLKMVDIDGHFTYSPVRVIKLGDEKTLLALNTYPNPVANTLMITLPASWQGKQVNIDLFNTNGQHIHALNIASASQTETISMTSFQSGAYFVKANCGNEMATQQVIKN